MQGWTHAVRCRSSSASKVQLVHLVKAWMGEVVEEKTRGIEGGGWRVEGGGRKKETVERARVDCRPEMQAKYHRTWNFYSHL